MLLPLVYFVDAQNCQSQLSMRKAVHPYRFNTSSKSATCLSGRKYEFVLPLTKGLDYRIQFFASPVFDMNIDFKIVDMNTNEVVVDLPGKVGPMDTPEKGKTVLQAYHDEKLGKSVNPYFDFFPAQSTSLKIMIDIKEKLPEQPLEYEYEYDEWGNVINQKPKESTPDPDAKPLEILKGCVTVYVIDKPSDVSEF